ncbi:MAG: SURF1 family cytochrome oxidase biogenesis protein [Actinomycetes bacterium]
MMNKSKSLRVTSTFLAVLLGTGVFFELGFWQLHRAQATSLLGKVVPSTVPVPLTSVDVAGKNIYTAAVNRIVTFQGRYVANYVAPTQSVEGQGYKDLSVGLFLISKNRAILVVRGLNDGSIKATDQTLSIAGRLYPRQHEDHGYNSAKSLGRLDPALIAGTGGYSLFDGYVIAIKEVDSSGQIVLGARVPAPVLQQSISGFYWQHISYVVIWWFMALLVMAAPFISRRSSKLHEIADKVGV